MRVSIVSTATLTATAALTVAAAAFGIGSATAQPDDYTMLLIDPNAVTDSTAYTPGRPYSIRTTSPASRLSTPIETGCGKSPKPCGFCEMRPRQPRH